MHVINVAASSYHWDNVASYDLTLRQLMAFKPHTSRAKTYNQGWNLAIRDPLGKTIVWGAAINSMRTQGNAIGEMTAAGASIEINASFKIADLTTDALMWEVESWIL